MRSTARPRRSASPLLTLALIATVGCFDLPEVPDGTFAACRPDAVSAPGDASRADREPATDVATVERRDAPPPMDAAVTDRPVVDVTGRDEPARGDVPRDASSDAGLDVRDGDAGPSDVSQDAVTTHPLDALADSAPDGQEVEL